jgi:hypothetical protein
VVDATDLNGVVHAIDRTDGKKRWTLNPADDPAIKVLGMVDGSLVVHGGRLYMATCNIGDGAGKTDNVVVCIGET